MAGDLITKSLRLAPEDSAALAEMAERLHCSPGVPARPVRLRGPASGPTGRSHPELRKGQGHHLAEAARIAHLPEDEFDEQLRLRGILYPGELEGEAGSDPEVFWASLRRVGEALGSERLLQAVDRIQAERERGGSVRT